MLKRESGQFLGETKSFISDSDIVDAFLAEFTQGFIGCAEITGEKYFGNESFEVGKGKFGVKTVFIRAQFLLHGGDEWVSCKMFSCTRMIVVGDVDFIGLAVMPEGKSWVLIVESCFCSGERSRRGCEISE